jgi:hypothetical protein
MATYKVVDVDKLDTDLKAVADSIRAKGGTTENLDFPADFVSAVGNIETGGGAKEEQEKTVEITENGTTEVVADEGKTMSKVTIETNVAFEGDIGKPYIDTSKITNFYYFCCNGRMDKYLDKLDTSNGTIFNYMFDNCQALKTIPQLDTSNGEEFGYMFSSCSSLETVSITTAKKNLPTNTFQGCTALKNITIGEGWNVNIYLHYSNNLTVESLHGMIENLADLTGQTAKTFQIGATNLAKIDEAHINMLKAKNWNYS